MSRSGYTYDCESLELWRGAVRQAINGRRGQQFFRDLLHAMDGSTDKRLVEGDLQCADGSCAMGLVASLRGVDVADIDDAFGDSCELVAPRLNIAMALAQEVAYVNDEEGPAQETPEQRFVRVRDWAEAQLAREGEG
ncbi:MAG: hypothetical protein AAF581_11065 [Planctomycetota bacterium]